MSSSFDASSALKAIRGSGPDKAVSFAFGQGHEPVHHVLAVEAGKKPESLMTAVKKVEGVGKAWCGEVRIVGGNPVFDCAASASGLQKRLEEWFKANKSPFKPKVITTAQREAEQAESEDEDDPRDPYGEELIRKGLALARKGPVHFAFALGRSAEDDKLILHRRLDGDRLAKQVRRDSGSTKIASGTVSVEGQSARFSCDDKPLSGLRKRMLGLFTGWKLSYKVVVLAPGANGDGLNADEVAEALAKMARRLKAAAGKHESQAGDLKTLFKAAKDAAAKDDDHLAAEAFARLQAFLVRLEAEPQEHATAETETEGH